MAHSPSPGSTSEMEEEGAPTPKVELVTYGDTSSAGAQILPSGTNDARRQSLTATAPSPASTSSSPSSSASAAWFSNSNTSIDQTTSLTSASSNAFFDRSYSDLSAFGRGSSTSFLNLPFDFTGRSSASFSTSSFLFPTTCTPNGSQPNLPRLFLDSNSTLQLQHLGQFPSTERVDQYLDPSLAMGPHHPPQPQPNQTNQQQISHQQHQQSVPQSYSQPTQEQQVTGHPSHHQGYPPQHGSGDLDQASNFSSNSSASIQSNLQARAPGYTPSHPFDLNTVMTAPGVPMGPVERFHYQQQMVEGPDFSSTLYSLASTLPRPTVITNGRTLESVGGGLHFQRNYPRRLVLGEDQQMQQGQQAQQQGFFQQNGAGE